MKNTKYLKGVKPSGVVFLVFLLFAFLVLTPLSVIWSLNTLFTTLLIPYTFKTWAAVVVLIATLGAKVK
jgi:hypothetical protein